MIGYVMVGSSDLQRSKAFYDVVLAPLGLVRIGEDDQYVGYAPSAARDNIEFYITRPINGEVATCGNGTMIALLAESRQAVDLFHNNALEGGGTDEGAPGLRAEDGSIYYAYVRDLDGNKICAFC